MMIEITEVYILITVSMILTFSQGHIWTRNQNICAYFFANFSIDVDEI